MDVIQYFLARYRREFDFFHEAARVCAQQSETGLEANGIRAIVTFRAKRPDRLEAKLHDRETRKRKSYASVDDIYSDIVDLAGVRIALYFPGDRHEVDKFITSQFEVTDQKEFPEPSDDSSPAAYKKRFTGYSALHYRVRLQRSTLPEPQQRYADAIIEIQVASVLMHAWAEVEHDLLYKPLRGTLSEDEYAILDELNGLVLAGEISLERLQKALETRVSSLDRPFNNHYELASYLYEAIRPRLQGLRDEPAMGRADILFHLLQRADLNRPGKLLPFIETLDADTERRPIAEQVMDQVLASNPELYEVLDEIRKQLGLRSPYRPTPEEDPTSQQDAIGFFMARWIQLERALNALTQPQAQISTRPGMRPLSLSFLRQLDIFDERTQHELEQIRRIRNHVVHGVEIPDAEFLRQTGLTLESLLDKLRNHPRLEVRDLVRPVIGPSSSEDSNEGGLAVESR